MSDIVPQKNIANNLTIRTIDDLSRLSNMLSKSGFFVDAKEAAQCGVKVLAGLELGFPTIASMCGVHIVNGKPTLGAHLMAAAVKRSGKYNYRVIKHDSDGCTIAFYENGEVIGESSFTRDDAVASGAIDGKNAHTWKKYPRNMMFARAMSNGVRWYCPDIFAGPVYTPDEMDLATDEEGNLTASVPVQVVQVESEVQPQPQVQTNGNHPNNTRVKSIRTLFGLDSKFVQEYLKTEYVASEPSKLEDTQLDSLILWMAEQWATKGGMHVAHARNSFKKHIPALVQDHGYSEVEAIKVWMAHVLEQAEQGSPAK